MFDLEIPWILDGIKRMFLEPDKFFNDIAFKEMNLIIPVVVLLLLGVVLGLTVYQKNVPAAERHLEDNIGLDVYHIEKRISAWKVEAIFYPIWTVLFWAVFTLCYTVFLGWLNGNNDFKAMFNCTSFLAYPHFVVSFLGLVFLFLPDVFKIFYLFIQLASVIWTVFILIKIAEGPGKLSHINAIFGALVPFFFLSMLWYLYDYGLLTGMLIVD